MLLDLGKIVLIHLSLCTSIHSSTHSLIPSPIQSFTNPSTHYSLIQPSIHPLTGPAHPYIHIIHIILTYNVVFIPSHPCSTDICFVIRCLPGSALSIDSSTVGKRERILCLRGLYRLIRESDSTLQKAK